MVPFYGEPALTRAVGGLLNSGSVDQVVIVTPPNRSAACAAALHTVRNARLHLSSRGADLDWSALAAEVCRDAEIVLIHDPARPFTPATVLDAVVREVRAGAPVAVPVQPVTDTIKAIGSAGVVSGTHDRTTLRSTQAPCGFRAEVLRELPGTDPLGAAVGRGVPVRTVPGHVRGMRLSTPFDRTVMAALLAEETT
ncbi:hypothetical protein GCM10027521_06100 [Amycolatopsis cihanbeyliensis]